MQTAQQITEAIETPINDSKAVEQHYDYRKILKAELDCRMHQNPRYSLRAFARDLGVAPSRLSEIFNHKQGLSRKVAGQIADILKFAESEKDYFLDLVSAAHARSRNEREMAKIRLLKHQRSASQYTQFTGDALKVVSEWYHLAILEMTRLQNFKNDPMWISRKLRIPPIQVDLAIERLIRVKLLRREGQKILTTTPNGWAHNEVPLESIGDFHRQLMTRAARAMEKKNKHEMEFSTSFITIDKRDLAAAKGAIRRFQQRFCSDLKKTPQDGEVYCLGIQFFNVFEEG